MQPRRRERLVRKHREYVEGTRDRDADFGDDDEAAAASPVPQPPSPPPRLSGDPERLLLRTTPRLFGKAPVAAHKELAEKAAESEEDDEDESYIDAEEDIPNDDFEYVKATTPSTVPPTRKKRAKILIKIAAAFEVLPTCPRYANANDMNND
ncbi:hypothetical protein ON010_g1382 [Phytophthora cinnamomi]|nr:hypothetical protein ON010_g1382 [Phytophthora cinnamomi]